MREGGSWELGVGAVDKKGKKIKTHQFYTLSKAVEKTIFVYYLPYLVQVLRIGFIQKNAWF